MNRTSVHNCYGSHMLAIITQIHLKKRERKTGRIKAGLCGFFFFLRVYFG